jgi:hypothetical protein
MRDLRPLPRLRDTHCYAQKHPFSRCSFQAWNPIADTLTAVALALATAVTTMLVLSAEAGGSGLEPTTSGA